MIFNSNTLLTIKWIIANKEPYTFRWNPDHKYTRTPFTTVCLYQQVMVFYSDQSDSPSCTEPSQSILMRGTFHIPYLSYEPVWFFFLIFKPLNLLDIPDLVQFVALKSAEKLPKQMAQSPEDAPLARGSLAGSEEVLVAPATLRGWEDPIINELFYLF